MRDQLCWTPARLKSHSQDSDSFFGALGFTMPVEELTLRMASLTNMLDWLAQPQGPHLVDGSSTENPLTALAILIAPEALYDSDSPMVGLGLVYKAPYIQTTSWTEAYFDLKLASQAITVRNLVMATRHLSRSREPIWATQQQPMKWVRSRFHPEATKLAMWSVRLSLGAPRQRFQDPQVEDRPLRCLPRGPRDKDLPLAHSASPARSP